MTDPEPRRKGPGPTNLEQLAAAFGPTFDAVTSPEPQMIPLAGGQEAWVVDTGPEDGIPVLFIGGTGTSATAVRLVEFLSSARKELGIRLIAIDRPGYGAAPLDPAAGYDEFAATALGVLDAFAVVTFSIVGISGGGPYAAAVAARAAERVRSIHLGAAYTGDPIAGTLQQICALPPDARREAAASSAADPVRWWHFPEDAPVHRIPGFVDAAVADAVRAFHAGDGGSDPAGLDHEFELFCRPTVVDVSAVTAPVFLYYGNEDTKVPLAYADQWAERFPNVVADRRFPGDAHDVQYRHWGQVLVDIASPEHPLTLFCRSGRPHVADAADVPPDAVLDSCAWAT
jgi:non-heme chloroperoxidase